MSQALTCLGILARLLCPVTVDSADSPLTAQDPIVHKVVIELEERDVEDSPGSRRIVARIVNTSRSKVYYVALNSKPTMWETQIGFDNLWSAYSAQERQLKCGFGEPREFGLVSLAPGASTPSLPIATISPDHVEKRYPHAEQYRIGITILLAGPAADFNSDQEVEHEITETGAALIEHVRESKNYSAEVWFAKQNGVRIWSQPMKIHLSKD